MLLYANVTLCMGMVMHGCGYGREALVPQEKGLTVKASSLILSRRGSEGSGNRGVYFVLLCPCGGLVSLYSLGKGIPALVTVHTQGTLVLGLSDLQPGKPE